MKLVFKWTVMTVHSTQAVKHSSGTEVTQLQCTLCGLCQLQCYFFKYFIE
jgi:hypothetical protein